MPIFKLNTRLTFKVLITVRKILFNIVLKYVSKCPKLPSYNKNRRNKKTVLSPSISYHHAVEREKVTWKGKFPGIF